MSLTEKARITFEKLFGVEPTPHPEDPELYEILQNEIFDEVFSTGVIDDQKREMITVVCLACMNTLPQLKAHVSAALHIGCLPLAVREAIYQCAPYIGYPKTLNAMAAANEVFKSKGIMLPMEKVGIVAYEDRWSVGRAIQAPKYGDEVREVCSKLPGDFSKFVPYLLTAVGFGDFATRGVLSEAEKELFVLIALTATGASAQLNSHIASTVKAGNPLEEVTAAIVQALPYIGFPYALNALKLVTEFDPEKNAEAYQ